jgi:23S rRNA (cytidine2498-2'-O)-methyltransferase
MTVINFNVESKYTVYLAFRGFEDQLEFDIGDTVAKFGRLFITEGDAIKTYWAQNIWFEAKVAPIESIGKAAKLLKDIQRNWYPYHITNHRRLDLIQSKLPHLKKKRWKYLQELPLTPIGSYTLLDEATMIYSPNCSEPIIDGEYEFEEDKVNPPSRAYLKLWETFTRFGIKPAPADKCLELGASPGGWTWVIAGLGAYVTAVDRSPLDKRLRDNQLICYRPGDAFKVLPSNTEQINWIFSDLICYPEKLYEFVQAWLQKTDNVNFVCTLKFQGREHYKWVDKFLEVQGSQVVHLYHNKHEFTWISLAEKRNA